MKPSDIAEAAADRVERGWCQGDYEDSDGNCCVVGAVLLCSGEGGDFRAPDVILPSLRQVIGGTEISWNDAPGRTQSEVSAALREAARRLRERGL